MAKSKPPSRLTRPSAQIVAQAPGAFRPADGEVRLSETSTEKDTQAGPQKPVPVKLDPADRDALASEFAEQIEQELANQEPFRQDLERWIKVYKAKPLQQTKNYPLAHASNVVVPVAKSAGNQIIARISQGIKNLRPAFVVSQLNKKFAETCKPYELFLEWNQKNMWDQEAFLLPFVQDCVKLGTAIGYVDFVNEPVIRYNDAEQKTEILGYRKHPKPVWVPREDFLIPTGFADLQTSPWIAHRTWCSWDYLEELSFRGFITNLDDLWGHNDEEEEVKVSRGRQYDDQVLNNQDGRFGLWSPWYVWFRRDLDQDNYPEQYVMMLHQKTKTVLRLVANPSPSGRRPYFKASFINVEGEFDGTGVPEDLEPFQDEVSTIHNQRRDAAHLANIVMYIAKMAAQIPDTIRPASGKVIKTPGGHEDIVQFNPTANTPVNMAEEEMVMRLANQIIGMNDIDLGKMSSPMGRAAATTVMAMLQENTKRFDLNIAGIQKALTEEAHIITELWQVYGLPEPNETGSPEQVLDEKEAQLVRILLSQPAPLKGLINIQLGSSTAAVNKEVEKQSNMQLFQLIQGYDQDMSQKAALLANPGIPPEVKVILLNGVKAQDKILSKLFQSFDAFDLDEVLAHEQMEALLQKSLTQPSPQAQAIGMGQAPQGIPGMQPGNGAAAPNGGGGGGPH